MRGWAASAALLALLWPPEPGGAQGPIPEPIASGLGARLLDVAAIPASSGGPTPALLNLLRGAGDGSGRVFVNDMRGKVWVIASDGSVGATPFLDVAAAPGVSLVISSPQLGFSTFAFHPDYASPGTPGEGLFFTVTHETTASGTPDFAAPTTPTFHNVLSEWQVSTTDPDQIDPLSKRELLRVEGFSGDHPMGGIGFDPNPGPSDPDFGLLFVALGDGGGYIASAGQEIDPFRSAQDLANPYGAILRIDPFGSSTPLRPTNGNYGIPADNPFVDAVGAVQEIWAYGLRNPHRFGWDSAGDGKMLISDIGQGLIEEIELGAAGANHGWSERQGTWQVDHDDEQAFPALPPNDPIFGYRYPVAQYDHDEGRAVVGAGVYRGAAIPALQGEYLFGDIVNGRLFHTDSSALVAGSQGEIRELHLEHDGERVTLLELVGAPRADLRFGTDDAGEIYVLSKRDAMVRKLPEPGLLAGLVSALLALGLLSGCAATTQRVKIECVPEEVAVYVDGRLLEGPSHDLVLRADTPHKIFFKGAGYEPQLLVLDTRTGPDGQPQLDRESLCVELVPVGVGRRIELDVEED